MQQLTNKNIPLTQVGLNRAIAIVAIPAMFSYVFQIFFELIDTYWLDLLQHQDIFASLGAASFITWSLYALMLLVNAGVNSLVARAAGAGNKKRWQILAWQGVFLSLGAGFIISLIMHFTHPAIFRMIGLEGQVFIDASHYFRIINFGYMMIFLYNLTGVVFNAHGDTKTSMWIGVFALVLNTILDPLLILGVGIFPKLGIVGAALATIFSQFVGLLIRLYYLLKREYISLETLKESLTFADLTAIARIGIPQAATHWVFSMVYPVLSHILTRLDNINALGALAICHRIEGVPYFAAVSLSVAAATLTGQHYGAGQQKQAFSVVNRIVLIGSLLLLATSYVFIFHPGRILHLFISAPDVIREGIIYLQIIGYFELFMAWEVIFEGAFTGFGQTLYPMFFSVPLTLARIPLAWYFAITLDYGVTGVWWAISLTTLLKGLFIGITYWSGFWRKKLEEIDVSCPQLQPEPKMI